MSNVADERRGTNISVSTVSAHPDDLFLSVSAADSGPVITLS